jgi:hypothetical protein
MDIVVLYSPQPDEQSESSAAYEYAKRTSHLLSKQHGSRNIGIHRLSVDSLNSLSDEATPEGSKTSNSTSPSCTFIIVSCSADGSVNRIVRKILRNLKNQKQTEDEVPPSSSTPQINGNIAIALLGHARCDNSANQMKDTIFNHGRKFHKCLEVANSSRLNVKDRLEVQVELEGPDASGGFDEWVNSNDTIPSI